MIQWFPGHMAKALKEMEANIKMVDMICILLDARIPSSSINPKLEEMFQNKKILYILTKTDKADPSITSKWVKKYQDEGKTIIACDVRDKKCIKEISKEADILMAEKHQKDAAKGLKKRPVKTMIVGIPNVGKSTLINTLCGKRVAVTGDKPGVTKNEQWTRINESFILLDTPGVLWPKFEQEEVGYNLVITGAIKDSIISFEKVALYFIDFLKKNYPNVLEERYNLDTLDNNVFLNELGKKELFILDNGEVDIEKVSLTLIQEYRQMRLGRISLDYLC